MSFGGFGGFAEEESQEVATSFGKTPTRTTNSSGPVGEKRIRNIPVTVRTALESALSATDSADLPTIYEVQAKYVEVFGQLESVNYDSSSFVCVINDGTGKIQLKQYFDQPIIEEGQESPYSQYTVGSFVWAIGALRTGSDPYVSINQMRKLTSANDIAYQILTTCAAHIDVVEEKDGTFGATPMRSFGGMHQASSTTKLGTMSTGFDMQDSTPMKPAQSASAMSTLSSSQIEDHVYTFIQSGKSTQWGFSKSDCVVKFKQMFSEDQVNKAIEQLLDDARIYDTGDDVHFKAIE